MPQQFYHIPELAARNLAKEIIEHATLIAMSPFASPAEKHEASRFLAEQRHYGPVAEAAGLTDTRAPMTKRW